MTLIEAICFAIAAVGLVAIFFFDRKAPKETAMTMQRKLAIIPLDLDYSRIRTSVDKKYIISISNLIDPVTINQIHQWKIRWFLKFNICT